MLVCIKNKTWVTIKGSTNFVLYQFPKDGWHVIRCSYLSQSSSVDPLSWFTTVSLRFLSPPLCPRSLPSPSSNISSCWPKLIICWRGNMFSNFISSCCPCPRCCLVPRGDVIMKWLLQGQSTFWGISLGRDYLGEACPLQWLYASHHVLWVGAIAYCQSTYLGRFVLGWLFHSPNFWGGLQKITSI